MADQELRLKAPKSDMTINNFYQQNQRHFGPDGRSQRRRITNGQTDRTREG